MIQSFITSENSNESISVKDENVTEGIKSADEEKDTSTTPGSTGLKNRIEVLVVEKIIEEDNQVLTSDAQIPQFPGGDDELVRWISTHIKYQDSAVNDNPQGSIFVELGVAMDGSINLVKVLHSPFSNFEGSLKSRDYLEHVVMSAVGKLPNFIPGNINCRYFIEVKFDFN